MCWAARWRHDLFDTRTGFSRDGSSPTDAHDHGRHVVCFRVTANFLAYSLAQGNDLMTPCPETLGYVSPMVFEQRWFAVKQKDRKTA